MAITMKAARVNKNLSQDEVSKALGINRITFSRYEANPGKMPADLFLNACKLYGVETTDIFMPSV